MAEKPTAAFILSLIGAVLIILNALVVAFLTAIAGRIMGMFLPMLGGLVSLIGVGGLFIGIIILVGAFMINSDNKSRVTTGSIIVLVFSIISFFMGGGFIIGLILCLVGSILGLTWNPPPAPPPPPSY